MFIIYFLTKAHMPVFSSVLFTVELKAKLFRTPEYCCIFYKRITSTEVQYLQRSITTQNFRVVLYVELVSLPLLRNKDSALKVLSCNPSAYISLTSVTSRKLTTLASLFPFSWRHPKPIIGILVENSGTAPWRQEKFHLAK
jgi:hypothetical protein